MSSKEPLVTSIAELDEIEIFGDTFLDDEEFDITFFEELMKDIPEERRVSIRDAIFEKATGILATSTKSESNKVKFLFIRNHWSFDRRTGVKLELGEAGAHVFTYRQILKIKKQLVFSSDVLDAEGKVIHSKCTLVKNTRGYKKKGSRH